MSPNLKKTLKILLILISCLILAFLFAFGFYVIKLSKEIQNSTINNQQSTINDQNSNPQITKIRKLVENPNSHYLGNPNGKIVITEFSDFNCTYCKSAHTKPQALVNKYPDLKFIFRDLPVLENSGTLAQIARCAGEQGYFWEMHNQLFENQGNITNIEYIFQIARSIDVEQVQFASCVENGKYISQIDKDLSDAYTLDITGTPTWFINGYKISGDLPLSAWEDIISRIKN